MPSEPAVGRNRLLLPLVGVSALCVVEAVIIAFLLGRGGGGATQRAVDGGGVSAPSNAAPTPAAPAAVVAPTSSDAPSDGPAITRGKLGERVESAGLAITVLNVTNEPQYKEIATPPATQKFVDVDVVIENRTGQPQGYFMTSFKIKDAEDRAYGAGGLGVHDPPLEWGTIVTGEKVRGHIPFVVPKDAKGLTLTYHSNTPPAGYRPIHIDLGQ